VLRLVHAAQQKIAHWAINKGYNIKNGGVGTVNAIVTEQAMLIAHAEISNKNLNGHSRKSLRAQSYIPVIVFVI
jgi:hypothetical protein